MTSDLSPNMTCDGKDTSNQSSPHTSFATDKLRQVVCLAEDLMIGYSGASFIKLSYLGHVLSTNWVFSYLSWEISYIK